MKYKVTDIFRVGEKWYNLGEVVELSADEAAKYMSYNKIVMVQGGESKAEKVVVPEKPKEENATDKRKTEKR